VSSSSNAFLIKYYIMTKNHLVSFWIEQHVGFHMNTHTIQHSSNFESNFFLSISKSRHEKHIQKSSNVLDLASS